MYFATLIMFYICMSLISPNFAVQSIIFSQFFQKLLEKALEKVIQ